MTSDAVLFDLDGVLTPTADVHMRAWQQLFVDFLTRRGIRRPYVESDYFDYIDGKPRYDGRPGLPGVPRHRAGRRRTDRRTRAGDRLRARKPQERVLLRRAARRRRPAVPRLGALLDELAERGIKVAVVSSSRNAPAVLEGRRPGATASRSSSTATSRRSAGCRASRHPTPTSTPRPSSGCRASGRWSSRTRSPASRPGGPAASGWWSGSTAGSVPTGCSNPAPTSWSPIWPSW